MNLASDDRQLGEYRLKELISESELARTWLAEQVSVARRVLVDELRPERADQQEAFLAAHPDVYERSHGAVRLKIRDGRIDIASLACHGYASAAMPDFSAMSVLSPQT